MKNKMPIENPKKSKEEMILELRRLIRVLREMLEEHDLEIIG